MLVLGVAPGKLQRKDVALIERFVKAVQVPGHTSGAVNMEVGNELQKEQVGSMV